MAMSRTQSALNRLELYAHRHQMTIEEALDILDGKHPTHKIKVFEEREVLPEKEPEVEKKPEAEKEEEETAPAKATKKK